MRRGLLRKLHDVANLRVQQSFVVALSFSFSFFFFSKGGTLTSFASAGGTVFLLVLHCRLRSRLRFAAVPRGHRPYFAPLICGPRPSAVLGPLWCSALCGARPSVVLGPPRCSASCALHASAPSASPLPYHTAVATAPADAAAKDRTLRRRLGNFRRGGR